MDLGHAKALSITEAREEAKLQAEDGTIPLIVFIGDGVSDLPAAWQADVLFARRGLRLEEYYLENKIPYIGYDTFIDIQTEIAKIMVKDEKKTGGAGKPVRFNPRADLWRRVSSKNALSCPFSTVSMRIQMLISPQVPQYIAATHRKRRGCYCGPIHSRNRSPKKSQSALPHKHSSHLFPLQILSSYSFESIL